MQGHEGHEGGIQGHAGAGRGTLELFFSDEAGCAFPPEITPGSAWQAKTP